MPREGEGSSVMPREGEGCSVLLRERFGSIHVSGEYCVRGSAGAYLGSSEHRETLVGRVMLRGSGMSGLQKQVPLSSFTLRACKGAMGGSVYTTE